MQTEQKDDYRPDIDGLRAVAVLVVVLHHLSVSLVPGGYVGVDVFFVISGYLITRIICREVTAGQFSFARFYERRARRIFPALFVMLGITLVTGYILMLPSDYAATLRGALGTVFFSSNIVYWREMGAGYFAASDSKLNPVLHTWSLAVEEQFYVLFPILLLVSYRYLKKQVFWLVMSCAFLSLAGAELLISSKSVAVFYFSPFRAWELLAGALLVIGKVPDIRSRQIREALAACGLLLILAACFIYNEKTVFPGAAALLPVIGTLAIIHACGSGSTLAGRLLRWRLLVYIGKTSYSLYLWHWPLIVMAQYALGTQSLTPYLPALFAISLLMGSLSYHLVEQPFRTSLHITRQRLLNSSLAFVSLLTCVSVIGLSQGGFSSRFDTEVIELDKARTPQIPYLKCVGQSPPNWCIIGDFKNKLNSSPEILLWGDSHLLAWAPALNISLAAYEQQGFLVPFSACPPLFDIAVAVNPECSERNLAIKNYLLAHTEIKTVLMSANWGWYFSDDTLLKDGRGGAASTSRVTVAQGALTSTVEWLLQHGLKVILIGPVPTYKKSVPLSLVMETATGRPQRQQLTASDQRSRHAPFFNVVAALEHRSSLRFLDPIQWLCTSECAVVKNALPLYRDAGHLSVSGAISMEKQLTLGLNSISSQRAEEISEKLKLGSASQQQHQFDNKTPRD